MKFKLGLAQAMEEQSNTFDAVLCHMVMMLMAPLPPVIGEVHRVLKPGGVFAGVVSGASASEFLMKYARALRAFTTSHFPNSKPISIGDSRTNSQEGLKEILLAGDFTDIQVREFIMNVTGTPEKVGSFFEDMYNVTLLPKSLKSEFITKLIQLAKEECAGRETMSFGVPMFLFSALKA